MTVRIYVSRERADSVERASEFPHFKVKGDFTELVFELYIYIYI